MGFGIYLPKKSIIHELDVRTKFLVFLIFYPLCAFLSNLYFAIILYFSIYFLVFIANIKLKRFLDQTLLLSLFIAVSMIILSVLFESGSIYERIYVALEYTIKILTFINAGVLFAMVVNPNDIPQALMKIGIHHKYGILLMLGLRLYPILYEKVRNIMYACRCRGLEISLNSKIFENLIMILIPIVIITLESGAFLGDTLIARGYNPNRPITISPKIKMKFIDWVTILLCFLILVAILIFQM